MSTKRKIRAHNKDVVKVQNILTQPIKKGNRVILWRRFEHEKVLKSESDCPEYECCLSDEDPDKDSCSFDDGTLEDNKTPDGQFCCQITDDQGNVSVQGVDEEFECAFLGGEIIECSSSEYEEDECDDDARRGLRRSILS